MFILYTQKDLIACHLSLLYTYKLVSNFDENCFLTEKKIIEILNITQVSKITKISIFLLSSIKTNDLNQTWKLKDHIIIMF